MEQSRFVYRRHRPAHIEAGGNRFRSAKHAAGRKCLLERQPFDELHAETDDIAVRVDAVDRHDVGMAHPREQPRFLEDGG